MFSALGKATFIIKNQNKIRKYSYDEPVENMRIKKDSIIIFRLDDNIGRGVHFYPGNLHLQMLHFEEYIVNNIEKYSFIKNLINGIYDNDFENKFLNLVDRYECYRQMEKCFNDITETELLIREITKKEIQIQKNKGLKVVDKPEIIISRDNIIKIGYYFNDIFKNIVDADYDQLINYQRKYTVHPMIFVIPKNFEVYRYEIFLKLCFIFFCKNIKKTINRAGTNIFLSFIF